jgi:hypothetical protein
MKAQPKTWSEELIAQAFDISKSKEGILSKSKNKVVPYFTNKSISETNGWNLNKWTDPTVKTVVSVLN